MINKEYIISLQNEFYFTLMMETRNEIIFVAFQIKYIKKKKIDISIQITDWIKDTLKY